MRCSRTAVAAVAAVVAAVLSACGGLATDSAVQQGSQVGEAAVQPVRVQPDGPAAGAAPDQIVRGFLQAGAGAGFDDDHAVARSFFAPNVKDSWAPDSGVKVYRDDATLKIELLTPSTVRVTAPVVAEVDGVGRYRETPAGTSGQATFGMQKLDVGWRISTPQKGFGLWLSASDLERIYRPFTIAYASTTAKTIVGDRRWFPITPGLATTLARAQLSQVPAYLAGAVRTGVPSGTRLAVDAVPIQSGLALVDLSSEALSADPELRRMMWAQFVTTLMQVPTVTEVSLQAAGAGLDVPGTQDRLSVPTAVGYQLESSVSVRAAILRTGADLSRVATDTPKAGDVPGKPARAPATGSALPRIPVGWVSLALSWDGQEIAAIGGDHADLARWQGSRMFQLPKFGTRLTKPSYDSRNGLWVAGESGGAPRVWVIDTSTAAKSTKPRLIAAPSLARRTVMALKVASDNQRVALITSDRSGGDVQVMVAGIVRSASGVALSLSAESLRVGWALTLASDLAWVDGSTLAVVGRVGTQNALGPQLLEIGGRLSALPPVEGARLVTNTGGAREVVVVTDRGKVLARAGNSWRQLQTGTDFLIPGQ